MIWVTLFTLLFPFAFAIRNPIIPGWNPDPSILRLDREYFLATSSFEYFPGVPIYRSTDLANWELFSHALTDSEHVQLYGVPTGAGKCSQTEREDANQAGINSDSRRVGAELVVRQWQILPRIHDKVDV